MKTGIQAFVDVLVAAGVKYLFGNPGTTELPLNDLLLSDRRLDYVLGLQEVPVMAMADGYAMASGKVAVVNLHISCGLGNALGMLYNAFREGTPLIVTAGQQDRRLMFEEPILWGDMVAVARPWTKWAAEVTRADDIPSAVRRAIQTALSPPTGPVFLSLPVDVQREFCSENIDLRPPTLPDFCTRPAWESLERAADLLRAARNPAILAGSRVTERDAMPELVSLAETLGAPVMTESGTTHGRLAFPSDHPLNGQGLPLWSSEVRKRLEGYDLLLVAGMDLFRQYIYHEPANPLPPGIKLVQIDEEAWQLGKNYPVDAPILGHTKVALTALRGILDRVLSDDQRRQWQSRGGEHAKQHAAAREQLRAKIASELDRRPLTPLALMGTLAKVLPPDVAVVEEAVTTTNTTFERLGALKNTTGYFGHRGWGLGWGLGVALGAKLAWPERPVLALLGEGAANYGIQGLWSAAKYNIPVVFVICNNAQYQILKICAQTMQLPEAMEEKFAGLDLIGPEVDLVKIAEGYGITACRISEPEELAIAVTEGFQGNRPVLIDVPIARKLQGRLNYG